MRPLQRPIHTANATTTAPACFSKVPFLFGRAFPLASAFGAACSCWKMTDAANQTEKRRLTMPQSESSLLLNFGRLHVKGGRAIAKKQTAAALNHTECPTDAGADIACNRETFRPQIKSQSVKHLCLKIIAAFGFDVQIVNTHKHSTLLSSSWWRRKT